MAISTVTNRVNYQCDGTSAVFAFPYNITRPSDLGVFIFNSSGIENVGIIHPQVLNTHYTFSGSQDSNGIYPNGGSIVFNSTPNIQSQVTIFRSSIVTNDFVVSQFGAIPATSLNNEIDYLTKLIQRLQDQVTRAVRIPDGLVGIFDPTLPANLLQSRGKPLTVGSGAVAFTFDPVLDAPYIPNTIIVAGTNSSLISLGGAPDGRFLRSAGSSSPQWDRVNVGSSESITGILPVTNGGTGVGSFTLFGILYASSATQIGVIPAAPVGAILTSNGSSVPTFQAFSANNINSGTVSVSFGGTGTSTSYIQYGLIFASSATQMASTPAGGTDVPLLGNGQAEPSFRALPLSSGSSVTGTLATTNGGTGKNSWTQFAVPYVNGTTTFSEVIVGGPGTALISNGSSAPSFQTISVTNTVSTKTANYIATANDRYLLLGSSAFDVTLTKAFTTGKELTVRNINSNSFLASQGIVGSGCLVNGMNSTAIHTYGEQLDLYFDGTNWNYGRTIPSNWKGYTPNILGFGSSIIRHAKWRRSGDTVEIDVMWRAGVGQAGVDLTLSMPSTDIRSPLQGSSTIGSTAFFGQCLFDVQSSNNYSIFSIYDQGATVVQFGKYQNTTSTHPFVRLQGDEIQTSMRFNLRGSMQVEGWRND